MQVSDLILYKSVEGYFLICENFNPAVMRLAVSEANVANIRFSLNKF